MHVPPAVPPVFPTCLCRWPIPASTCTHRTCLHAQHQLGAPGALFLGDHGCPSVSLSCRGLLQPWSSENHTCPPAPWPLACVCLLTVSVSLSFTTQHRFTHTQVGAGNVSLDTGICLTWVPVSPYLPLRCCLSTPFPTYLLSHVSRFLSLAARGHTSISTHLPVPHLSPSGTITCSGTMFTRFCSRWVLSIHTALLSLSAPRVATWSLPWPPRPVPTGTSYSWSHFCPTDRHLTPDTGSPSILLLPHIRVTLVPS